VVNRIEEYQEFQFGWIIFVFIVPIQILIAYCIFLFQWPRQSTDGNGRLPGCQYDSDPYLSFVLWTDNQVTGYAISVSFGVGLISKSIRLNRIKTIETVKNPWYYGWGLRIIPEGMLYNIGGSDAIEIKFIDTSRVIRIGTKDSYKLKSEILLTSLQARNAFQEQCIQPN
jgi:hypothetical protein